MKSSTKSRSIACLAVSLLVSVALPVHAQLNGFFIGGQVSSENAKATFNKIVDNSHPENRSDRAGLVFEDEDASSDSKFSFGGFAGYRSSLFGITQFMSVQVDIAVDAADVSGFLEGVGNTTSLRQTGESWPESWRYTVESETGLTVKYGRALSLLGLFEIGAYLLGSYRESQGTLTTISEGCLNIDAECAPGEFVTSTINRDTENRRFSYGVGIEQTLAEKYSLQLEVDYTPESDQKWEDPYFDNLVVVPLELVDERTSVRLNLVRYF